MSELSADDARPCAHIHGDEISECSWCGSLPGPADSVVCPACGMELVTAPAQPDFGLEEQVLHKGKMFRTSRCPARNDGQKHA